MLLTSVRRGCHKGYQNGAELYRPLHGFASGSRAVTEWYKFLESLESRLAHLRESAASSEELTAAYADSHGIVPLPLRYIDILSPDSTFMRLRGLAAKITRLRGRDPSVGEEMRRSDLPGTPLNKGAKVVLPPDPIDESLLNPDRFLDNIKWGDLIYNIVERFRMIRDASGAEATRATVELGALAVRYQIRSFDNRYGADFFFCLTHIIRNRLLRYQLSHAIREALKTTIKLDKGSLQSAAAKITIQYPEDCSAFTLRAVPVHHRLREMLSWHSRIVIDPYISTPERAPYYHPVKPPFLEHRYKLEPHSDISPAQCLISTTRQYPRITDGFLTFLSFSHTNIDEQLPFGDLALSGYMTRLVNERLARTKKG